MALAIVYSRAAFGMQAPLVTVEVHLSPGMANFMIVGLPETAVKESRDRVRSALINSQFDFPQQRITVNLAPADLPKEGGRFDLAIAIGILAASQQIPFAAIDHYEFTGELALSGELRGVRGILPQVLAAKAAQRKLIVPSQNAAEAGLINEEIIFSAPHLLAVCAHLRGITLLSPCSAQLKSPTLNALDLLDVKGQLSAKRALEVAAAGRHSLLLVGPPGTGKTLLASRLPSILPPLTLQEALEVAAVASLSKKGFVASDWQQLPFRSPHHTTSSVALVGGGRPPQPGEISLAHRGVLFLDELPEFNRHVLESLREPLESHCVTISRAAYQTVFPAAFQLIAAMNPCPCGFAGSALDACQCSAEQVKRYRNRLSGPFLDRIDLQVTVPRLPPQLLQKLNAAPGEPSAAVRERVMLARERQQERQGKCNAVLFGKELEQFSALSANAETKLLQAMERFQFSARVFHRIIKVARTIADLAGSVSITEAHLAEALQYRFLEKTNALNPLQSR